MTDDWAAPIFDAHDLGWSVAQATNNPALRINYQDLLVAFYLQIIKV